MSLTVVQQFVERVRILEAGVDLFRLLCDVTGEIGFRYFALIGHVDLRCPSDTTIRIENYPESWAWHFVEKGLYAIDPILCASLTTHVGFSWNEVPTMIRATSQQKAILESAARVGLSEGFTIPANIPGERPGFCSFATQQGLGPPARNLPLTQLIGAFPFQAARRLKGRNIAPLRQTPRLTPQQRDCLLWAIRGKTDWEISRILGLSEQTVTQHLDMARQRYNVTKRIPLAVRAVFNGQISFTEALLGQFPLSRE